MLWAPSGRPLRAVTVVTSGFRDRVRRSEHDADEPLASSGRDNSFGIGLLRQNLGFTGLISAMSCLVHHSSIGTVGMLLHRTFEVGPIQQLSPLHARLLNLDREPIGEGRHVPTLSDGHDHEWRLSGTKRDSGDLAGARCE
jgi:hypothetical protein